MRLNFLSFVAGSDLMEWQEESKLAWACHRMHLLYKCITHYVLHNAHHMNIIEVVDVFLGKATWPGSALPAHEETFRTRCGEKYSIAHRPAEDPGETKTHCIMQIVQAKLYMY